MSNAELVERMSEAISMQKDIIDEMYRLLTSIMPVEELDKTGLLYRMSRVASLLSGIDWEDEP